ncbi:MAG: biotin transporter BioY [Chlamydiales bacterium]|nr:biotin transporter BioY [Chlamydiales bacterium]
MTILVDLIRPRTRSFAIAFDCLTVLAGSIFLGVMAQLAFPLWFTPVPLSMLPFGIMLVGATCGSKKGALSVLAFLVEGAFGLPMFAGFSGGMAVLFGASGGYLLASALSAFLIGYFLERGWVYKYSLTTLALTIGTAVMYLGGFAWLSCFVGMKQAFVLGVVPFLIGDAIKVGAAAALVPTCWKLRR